MPPPIEPPNIVTYEQGTEEWLEWRRTKYSASEAGVIIGCAPNWMQVKTWDDLRMVKADLAPTPTDWSKKAFAHGHRQEEVARAKLAPGFVPVCMDRGEHAASLDGWYQSADLKLIMWAEIKCPLPRWKNGRKYWPSKLLEAVEANGVEGLKEQSPHIWWQLVHQAYVIGYPHAVCRFIVYATDQRNVSLEIPSSDLLPLWPRLASGWKRWAEGGPFIPVTAAWGDCADRWAVAKKKADTARDELNEVAAELKALGDGHSRGVCVHTNPEKKQPINWKAFAEHLYMVGAHGAADDFDEAAEEYRPDSKPETRVFFKKGA